MSGRRYRDMAERLMANSQVNFATGCWIWTGARHKRRGYALVGVREKGKRTPRVLFAHRVSFETFKGPLAEGQQVDHLCRCTPCINPQHLEAVTRAENLARRYFGRSERPYGYELAGEPA